ncbi:MAG TPA: YfbU family protein [Gemmatimonadaceae bacterium]
MALSMTERWILSNQYRILAALYPDEAEALAERREAIESGYEAHYEPDYIYRETMSVGACDEVVSILNMFRALKRSYEALTDKSEIEPDLITFRGFDGNNETMCMAYARYFCKHDGGRFRELNIKDFDSHMPTLARYRQMLSRWQGIGSSHEMTKEHILHVLGGRVEGLAG